MGQMSESFPRISDPEDFGQVAVLLGGSSEERDISLMTGEAVLKALKRRGITAEPIDPATTDLGLLPVQGFDRAWIALHGPGGEDGTIQGALDILNLPYTGTGVLGSALSMDKLRSKLLFRATDLPTPPFAVLQSEADFPDALQELGLPLITKPIASGSSVGMRKVTTAEELPAAFSEAARHGGPVLAEAWISGGEYTAAILHGEVLPLIRIETPRTFYDYEAKYFTDSTRYICPCELSPEVEGPLADQSLRVFEVLGGSGWGRVDFIVDADGVAQFLEMNTVPGMTDHSLVPMAARQAGMDFDELTWRILETSFGQRDEVPALENAVGSSGS